MRALKDQVIEVLGNYDVDHKAYRAFSYQTLDNALVEAFHTHINSHILCWEERIAQINNFLSVMQGSHSFEDLINEKNTLRIKIEALTSLNPFVANV